MKVSKEVRLILDSDEYYSLAKVKSYIELKELLQKDNEKKFDISKILSSVGLLFITVIPILLQWFLEML